MEHRPREGQSVGSLRPVRSQVRSGQVDPWESREVTAVGQLRSSGSLEVLTMSPFTVMGQLRSSGPRKSDEFSNYD